MSVKFSVVYNNVSEYVSNNACRTLSVKGTAVDNYADSIRVLGLELAENNRVIMGIFTAFDCYGGLPYCNGCKLRHTAAFMSNNFTVNAVIAAVIGVA